MEILGFLKSKRKKQFVSEIDLITKKERQSHLAIETLVGLRELNIEEEDEFSIDYAFFTDSLQKTQNLVGDLKKRSYSTRIDQSRGLFIITGQTRPLQMTHEVLKKWTADMCALGYEHDCYFDDWRVAR